MFYRLPLLTFYKIFMVCVFLSCTAHSVYATNTEYRFDRLWPKLDPSWYFKDLKSLADASDGSIYVCGENKIRHFKFDGTPINEWPSESCAFIAMGSNNNVYVASSGNTIKQYQADGSLIRQWQTNFDAIATLVIAPDGNLYVTDQNSNQFAQYRADGNLVRQWASSQREDRFVHIAIAPDGSGYYLANSYNHSIQQFSVDGTYIRNLKNTGLDGVPYLLGPMAILPNGHLLVKDPPSSFIDTSNVFIQEYDTQGDYVKLWKINNLPNYIEYINLAFDGTIYVLSADRIQHITVEGTIIRQISSAGFVNGRFSSPQGVAVAPDNSLYVADTGNNRIQQFTPNGTFIRQWLVNPAENGKINKPTAIAVGPNGHVYVVDSGNNRVLQFTAEGTYIRQWGGDGQFITIAGIVVAKNGSVYVADQTSINPRIQQFTADGDYIRQWALADAQHATGAFRFNFLRGLTIAPDQSLYVAIQYVNDNLGDQHYCQRFTAEGSIIKTPPCINNFAVTIGPDGSSYAISAINSIEISAADGSNGQALGILGAGTGAGQFQFLYRYFSALQNLTVAPDGSLYVADTLNNRIQKFVPRLKGYPAEYDANQQVLHINDVTVAGQHYQLDLAYQNGQFVLDDNINLLANSQAQTASYDANGWLTIPLVRVLEKDYSATFKQQGNNHFSLESLTPVQH